MRSTIISISLFALGLLVAGCDTGSGPRPGTTAPRPVITRIAPDHALAGEAVTIAGDGFELDRALDAVLFGQTQGQVTSATTRELVVVVPALPAGAVQVTVSTRGGTSAPASFTVDPTPGPGPTTPPAPLSITRLVPPVAQGGGTLRIEGRGFSASLLGNDVRIGGAPALVTSARQDALTVQLPAGARSGPVTVRVGADVTNAVVLYVTSPNRTVSTILDPQGARARDYLAGDHTHLVVEVDCIAGHAPSSEALNLMAARLSERTTKPGGITFLIDETVGAGSAVWSIDAVRAFEDAHRDHFHIDTTAVYYIAYLDGRAEGDTASGRTLGVSYSATSMALFQASIRQSATAAVPAVEVEGAVGVHELGHNLGLVNNGTPATSAHEDPAHRAHDVSKDCVMFWEIGIHDAERLRRNGGRLRTQFDAACIADLRANGGR